MHHRILKSFILIFTLLITSGVVFAQKKSKDKNQVKNTEIRTTPKLVVGIVVDQMRYDYLTRFWSHYGLGGFKRMVNEGFNCKNHHFNYAPTSTGPGHTSVYTGAAPATHGIIGNNWYDKVADKEVYCAGDDSFKSVGTVSNAGEMSPHRMLTTTITDELRLHNQMRSKTIAVALKDRGAVLTGGHTANGAYWFHGADEGKWVTSTFYMQQLPKWVADFNASSKVRDYKKPWTTLKDIKSYVESLPDDNPYEGLFENETAPVFPHSTPNMLNKNKDFEIIKYTPFGNSLTTDFALAAVDGENLGKDMVTDFLAISFSSTDYVGHKYGVDSKEVQDMYLQLDRDLERLFNALDKKVGTGEYTVFLSADHGAVPVPSYLMNKKIPAGYFSTADMKKKLDEYVQFAFGTTDLVKNISNYQVFLDRDVIRNLDMNLKDVQEALASELLTYDDIDRVYTGYQMWQNNYTKGIPYILQNGFNQKRSGDILIVLRPDVIDYSPTGSSHGSPQIYDTHTPLLFFGKGIKRGSTVNRTEIPDIAPTISALLGISFPSGTTEGQSKKYCAKFSLMKDQPLGMFDSGVGGTSIWKEIHELLPSEHTIYLADSKNAPYGEKSEKEILALSIKNTEFLLQKGCKLIVVACNTATTNAIDYLRKKYDIPFIGIEPAIKPAALKSESKTIGVLATKGTLASSLFHSTSENHASGIRIIEREGTGLVRLIESGKAESEVGKELLEIYLAPMLEAGIDHLVLGCTHYPYLIPGLKKMLPEGVKIIDSGEAVARQTKAVLKENDLLNLSKEKGTNQFYTNSDVSILKNFLTEVDGPAISFLDF